MKLFAAEKAALWITGALLLTFAGYLLYGTIFQRDVRVVTERGGPASIPASVLEPPAPAETGGVVARSLREDGRLDLNAATLEELESLPEIGPVLAERILDYRTEHGGFHDLSELLEIQGVGEKTYETIEAYLKVG